MTEETFLDKYPEFKEVYDKVISTVYSPNNLCIDLIKVLDKNFVRKEDVMKQMVFEMDQGEMEPRAVKINHKRFIAEYTVKQAIDEIKEGNFSGRNWKKILKKELGLEK